MSGGIRLLHVREQRRLVEEAVLLPLQRGAEEAHELLQEADRRPGRAVLGRAVAPRPDQPAHPPGHGLEHAQHRVAVAVGPAADREHVAVELARALARRADLPVVVAALVREPGGDERLRAVEPLDPARAPRVADDRRVGRLGPVGLHRRRPVQHVEREHAAAAVVHVVGEAVVGEVQRGDRAQRRRTPRGRLHAREPAPADPGHPDLARAPRLLGEPRDHGLDVPLLLLRVLVSEDPVGVAAPAQVEPQAAEAVAGQVGVLRLVADRGAVALAVRDGLEDRGHRVGLGVLGPPQPGGEPRAVGERDPQVLDQADAAGELGADLHAT